MQNWHMYVEVMNFPTLKVSFGGIGVCSCNKIRNFYRFRGACMKERYVEEKETHHRLGVPGDVMQWIFTHGSEQFAAVSHFQIQLNVQY